MYYEYSVNEPDNKVIDANMNGFELYAFIKNIFKRQGYISIYMGNHGQEDILIASQSIIDSCRISEGDTIEFKIKGTDTYDISFQFYENLHAVFKVELSYFKSISDVLKYDYSLHLKVIDMNIAIHLHIDKVIVEEILSNLNELTQEVRHEKGSLTPDKFIEMVRNKHDE